MARRKSNLTKLEIMQVAMKMFLEKGFTNTSAKAISNELNISTGNLTFYFPTKNYMISALRNKYNISFLYVSRLYDTFSSNCFGIKTKKKLLRICGV